MFMYSTDSKNEQEVQHAINNIMKNKTTIIVAHRLSTIKNADEIICMKNGYVIERGLWSYNIYLAVKRIHKKLVWEVMT